MKRFSITTLGCRVNQSESAAVADALRARGLRDAIYPNSTDDPTSDICIINTCTVTQKASMQSRQAIRRAMRENPRARIIVTGCYAQIDPEAIKQISPHCEIVGHLGNKDIVQVITAEQTPAPKARPLMASSSMRTRPVVKIQDGCDAFCTYCIVPFARGRSRSLPPSVVMDEIDRLHAAGYQEAVLSGIHLGCYGRDLEPATDLLALLERIIARTNMARLRLSSIEPLELNTEIINLAAASKRICHHFHIPLQSGDDQILKRMGRPYGTAQFKKLVFAIKKRLPDAAIGVDTLVGFPGETEAAFANTFNLIKELPVSYLHVFPFSPRPKTPAAGFKGQVAAQDLKNRTRRMRRLGFQKKEKFYHGLIGKRLEVLVEVKRDRGSGMLRGITGNYVPVLLDGDEEVENKLIQCCIGSVDENLTVRGAS